MNREEAAKLLPIIKAFSEGKTIQFYDSQIDIEDIENWEDCEYPDFDATRYKFRIKPEPKYHPFKGAEECWCEMQKHQPFGWLKTIGVRTHFAECKSIGELVMIGLENTPHIYEYAFHTYTFADGTPFGVKVEE